MEFYPFAMALTHSDSGRTLVFNVDALGLTTMASALRLQGVDVIGEALTTINAENLYYSLKPQVVLIDLPFDGDEVLSLILKFRKTDPELGIVLLTSCPDLRLFGIDEQSLPRGTRIILKKSISDVSTITGTLSASRALAKKGAPSLWIGLDEHLKELSLESLTDVQIETLRLLAQGLTNAEIARIRYVSEKSVEQSVARIAQHMKIPSDKYHNLRVQITAHFFQIIGASR